MVFNSPMPQPQRKTTRENTMENTSPKEAVKYCSDCLFCLNNKGQASLCEAQTGSQPCEEMRKAGGLCGPEGQLFSLDQRVDFVHRFAKRASKMVDEGVSAH